jgi:hypothetical protein
MAYFIFQKNSDNIQGTLYRIAENQEDLNNLNIINDDYKIIEDSQSNFDAVKYGTKNCISYNGNIIKFENCTPPGFRIKLHLKDEIDILSKVIQNFLELNSNNSQFKRWSDYKNQLNSLNLDSIQYPLNTSLEQYFNDQNLPSLNRLQIP